MNNKEWEKEKEWEEGDKGDLAYMEQGDEKKEENSQACNTDKGGTNKGSCDTLKEEEKELSEIEIEILLEENPSLAKALKELVSKKEKKLIDPRIVVGKKEPYVNTRVFICSICEDIVEESVLLSWVPRLSSYVREKKIKKEDIGELKEDKEVYVNNLPCPSCPSRLEFFPKNILIKKLLFSPIEKEVFNRKLREDFFKKEKEGEKE